MEPSGCINALTGQLIPPPSSKTATCLASRKSHVLSLWRVLCVEHNIVTMANKPGSPVPVYKRVRSHSLGHIGGQPPPTRLRSSSCSMSQRLEFQHEPLDLKTASIRLIEVLPLDETGLVQCKIRHATTETKHTCIVIRSYHRDGELCGALTRRGRKARVARISP
jgi:hypothetical protein